MTTVRERERRRTESESDAEIGWSAGLQAGIEVPSAFRVKGGAVRSAGFQADVIYYCERFLYDEDAGLETGAPDPSSEIGSRTRTRTRIRTACS